MKRLYIRGWVIAFCLCLVAAGSSFAQSSFDERIRSFDSHVRVNFDGSLKVTETIRVKSSGFMIKHGIYRDFPTQYRDRMGNAYRVGFGLTRVLRDGVPEPYSIQPNNNGVRIYIGKKGAILSPGEYVYTLEYVTRRQLGFFKDFDELYWNVTGNGWVFPMDQVTCTIDLPYGADAQIRERDAYTGFQGAKGRNFATSVDDVTGGIRFATTRPFEAHEGLTIVVSWPKGFVREPTSQERFMALLGDNLSVLAGIAGIFIVFLYYLYVWFSVGRDPQKGVIIPLYGPPAGIAPAAMRYLVTMGFDNKVLAAALIDMAVKGYLKIQEEDGDYTLERMPDYAKADLTREEESLAKILFEGRESIALKNRNYLVLHDAIEKLKRQLSTSYEKAYFITNSKYFFTGLAVSLVVLVVTEVLLGWNKLVLAVFMTVWLSFWSLGVYALVVTIFQGWKSAMKEGSASQIPGAIGVTLFGLPFFAGEIFGLCALIWSTSILFIIFFLCIVCLNIVFYHLLKAPTALGRKTLDAIEGFKMYLSVAEKQELKSASLPEKTPELFERYFPYALALGVEQQWSEKFAAVLSAQTGGPAYQPAWYSSTAVAGFSAVALASSLGGTFSGALAAGATAPGSSSGGGGGGSSGGGSGGGGGGGW